MTTNKFENGKIYKIVSDLTDKIYIGSTTQKLCSRLSGHKRSYKQFLNGNYHNITSFEIIKLGDAQIFLIETFKCNNKQELDARERFYIELNKAIVVNKCIPGRTLKEYRNDNKQIIENQKKEYYNNNKEAIANQMKEYYEINKEAIANQKKVKFECQCGSKCRVSDKTKHLKTKKHLKYIESNQN